MQIKSTPQIQSLTLYPDIPLPKRGVTSLRGRLTEHAALTFLAHLRSRYPEVFKDWKASDILNALFRRREYRKIEGLETIIDLLYQEYPGFVYFHNHQPRSRFCQYEYPLIHYRMKKGKAILQVFEEAIPTVQAWLDLAHPDSWMNRDKVRTRTNEEDLTIHDHPTYYRLMDWNAFNNDNYRLWKKAELMRDRLDIMEQALTGQLRNIAQAFGLEGIDSIYAEIVLLKNIRPEKTFRHMDLVANILFRSNLYLPSTLAIGRSVSIGYGTQQRTRWQGAEQEAQKKEQLNVL